MRGDLPACSARFWGGFLCLLPQLDRCSIGLVDSDRFSEIEVGDEVSSSADFGVRVCGDSMEPLYLDGQIIWIHKQETLEEGEIGVFFLDGDAYVKKYHQSDSGIQLISLNKKYAPIQVTSGSTLKTFGKVVG